jgi:hypothetical protein
VRVDVGQGEVAEGETKAAGQACRNMLDLAIGATRVGTFVVAVFEDQRA